MMIILSNILSLKPVHQSDNSGQESDLERDLSPDAFLKMTAVTEQ